VRAAGLRLPIVIDAAGWGREEDYLLDNAAYLLQQDPEHNLVFSWHPWDPAQPASRYQTAFDSAKTKGICLIVGEFAQQEFGDKPAGTGTIDYKSIMSAAQPREIGWLWVVVVRQRHPLPDHQRQVRQLHHHRPGSLHQLGAEHQEHGVAHALHDRWHLQVARPPGRRSPAAYLKVTLPTEIVRSLSATSALPLVVVWLETRKRPHEEQMSPGLNLARATPARRSSPWPSATVHWIPPRKTTGVPVDWALMISSSTGRPGRASS